MDDYVAPDPKVASFVYERQAKFEQDRERLGALSEDELKAIVQSTSKPELRIPGLSVLMERIIRTANHRLNFSARVEPTRCTKRRRIEAAFVHEVEMTDAP